MWLTCILVAYVYVNSAYGNVGFTTGYSCERQLHREANCLNKSIGFVGKWSDKGKIILIFVMLFGRLKKFNMDGGKAWKLLWLNKYIILFHLYLFSFSSIILSHSLYLCLVWSFFLFHITELSMQLYCAKAKSLS